MTPAGQSIPNAMILDCLQNGLVSSSMTQGILWKPTFSAGPPKSKAPGRVDYCHDVHRPKELGQILELNMEKVLISRSGRSRKNRIQIGFGHEVDLEGCPRQHLNGVPAPRRNDSVPSQGFCHFCAPLLRRYPAPQTSRAWTALADAGLSNFRHHFNSDRSMVPCITDRNWQILPQTWDSKLHSEMLMNSASERLDPRKRLDPESTKSTTN